MGKGFLPHVTSYDYDAPISEAGSIGQPGIGGPSKFQVTSCLNLQVARLLQAILPRRESTGSCPTLALTNSCIELMAA